MVIIKKCTRWRAVLNLLCDYRSDRRNTWTNTIIIVSQNHNNSLNVFLSFIQVPVKAVLASILYSVRCIFISATDYGIVLSFRAMFPRLHSASYPVSSTCLFMEACFKVMYVWHNAGQHKQKQVILNIIESYC